MDEENLIPFKADPLDKISETLSNLNQSMISVRDAVIHLEKQQLNLHYLNTKRKDGDITEHTVETAKFSSDLKTPETLRNIVNSMYEISERERETYEDEVKQFEHILNMFTNKFTKGILTSFKSATSFAAPKDKDGKDIKLKDQTGFKAGLRRGIVDPYDDLGQVTGKSDKWGNRIGKFLGAMNLTSREREAHGRHAYQLDLEYERASSTDPEVRNKILPHEQRAISKYEQTVQRGKIPLNGNSFDEHIKKREKDIIAFNNLNSLLTKAPTVNVEYQEQAYEQLYGTRANPTESTEPKQKETKNNKNNSNFYRSRAKSFVTPTPQHKLIETPIVQSDEDFHRDLIDKFSDLFILKNKVPPTFPKREVENISAANNINQHIESNNTEPKTVVDKIPSMFEFPTSIDKLNVEKLSIKDITFKSLKIEQLLKPETDTNSAEQAAEGEGGIDISRSRINIGKSGSKLGKLAKTGGKLLGKVALPVTAALAAYDGFEGYNNAENNLDIKGRQATFGEKISSAVGGIASGLSFGLLDEKKSTQFVNGLFGNSKEENDALIKSDAVKQNEITPLKDQKLEELNTLNAENETLKSESVADTGSTNINVVNANQISTKGSGSNITTPTTTRPSYNAYERFVDRVFTVV